MQEIKEQNGWQFDYSVVEPLDWGQLRTLLWDAVDKFPASATDRWESISEFVNQRCPNSSVQSPSTYKTVFERILRNTSQMDEESTEKIDGCKLWTKILYQTAQTIFSPNPVFMNLGFVDLTPLAPTLKLNQEDEIYRLAIQLYHHVIGDADLTGKDILEVGCGCGGGASYLTRTRPLKSYLGVDILPRHIEICNQVHRLPKLSFQPGDAENLPFPDQTFDVVINIESSHSYPSMDKFLSEVKRVLRPGGEFRLADLRPTNNEWNSKRNLSALRQQIAQSGLCLIAQTNITENVLAAMDALENVKQMMLDLNGVSGTNRQHFEEIMLCQGSFNYSKLKNGDWEYWSFVLQ